MLVVNGRLARDQVGRTLILLDLNYGFFFFLQKRNFKLRVVLMLFISLLELIQLSLAYRHRLNDGVFDVGIKFIWEIGDLRIAKANVWKIEEHHDDLIFRDRLSFTKVENDEDVLV